MTDHVRLRPEALEWREVEGEIVALDLRTARYLAMNRTGTVIWPDLVEGASRGQLAARLVERYGVAEETAAADVDAFVAQLAERDLLDG